MIQVLKQLFAGELTANQLWHGIVEWFLGPVPQHKTAYYNGRSIFEV